MFNSVIMSFARNIGYITPVLAKFLVLNNIYQARSESRVKSKIEHKLYVWLRVGGGTPSQ